jgi:site-specific recombinase XerD
MKTNDFAYLLSSFFQKYLPGNQNVSTNTIRSYRDSFTLLLTYLRDVRSLAPEKLCFIDLDRKVIEDFLFYLEHEHHNGISTRNQRLAAIKSFFRFAQIEQPEHLLLCQSIISIRTKKSSRPVIGYLSGDETKALLRQPDATTLKGLRDLALLSLLYDSAARVQEVCDLTVSCIRLQKPPVARLYGKGRKTRDVPLSNACAEILDRYIHDNRLDRPETVNRPLFFNSQKKKLTRSGVSYILRKYINTSNGSKGKPMTEKITPHCLRHSKAMHLVEAGVNLIYIRDFLGHESIETTQVYAKANPEARRKALESVSSIAESPSLPEWKDDADLMRFLKGL